MGEVISGVNLFCAVGLVPAMAFSRVHPGFVLVWLFAVVPTVAVLTPLAYVVFGPGLSVLVCFALWLVVGGLVWQRSRVLTVGFRMLAGELGLQYSQEAIRGSLNGFGVDLSNSWKRRGVTKPRDRKSVV